MFASNLQRILVTMERFESMNRLAALANNTPLSVSESMGLLCGLLDLDRAGTGMSREDAFRLGGCSDAWNYMLGNGLLAQLPTTDIPARMRARFAPTALTRGMVGMLNEIMLDGMAKRQQAAAAKLRDRSRILLAGLYLLAAECHIQDVTFQSMPKSEPDTHITIAAIIQKLIEATPLHEQTIRYRALGAFALAGNLPEPVTFVPVRKIRSEGYA